MVNHRKSNFVRVWGIVLRVLGFIILIPAIVTLFDQDTYGWILLVGAVVCLIIARLFSSFYVLVRAAEYYLHEQLDIDFMDKEEIESITSQITDTADIK